MNHVWVNEEVSLVALLAYDKSLSGESKSLWKKVCVGCEI